MTFRTYIKLYKIYFTFFSYWLITTMITAYAKRDKSLYFQLLGALLYASLFSAIVVGVIHWFDLHISLAEYLSASSSTTIDVSNLPLDPAPNRLDLEIEKYKAEQKEIEELQKGTIRWVLGTLLVWYILFSPPYK